MKTFSSRLKHFIDNQLNISVSEFEKILGIPNGGIHRALNGTNIGIDKITLIAKKYPTLNMDWLVTGEGTMFETDHTLNENQNQDQFMDPNVKYFSNSEVLDRLSTAILNFSSNQSKQIEIENKRAEAEIIDKQNIGSLVQGQNILIMNNEKLVSLLEKKM